MYLNYIFFFITITVFSQPFFNLDIDPVYIDIKTTNDIEPVDFNSISPFLYEAIPDLSHLHPIDRKQKFIALILPAILIEKHKIKKAYNYVLTHFDNMPVNEITKNIYAYCNCDQAYDLLLCLKEQPTSIILAQAAIESGWGTSRFFLEGFNLFGIHSYGKKGEKIQAANASQVYVKKYNSILESISDYLRTLATVNAYSQFRKQRIISDDVHHITNYLTSYSERRQLYIDDIKSIIDFNHFVMYDTLKISN